MHHPTCSTSSPSSGGDSDAAKCEMTSSDGDSDSAVCETTSSGGDSDSAKCETTSSDGDSDSAESKTTSSDGDSGSAESKTNPSDGDSDSAACETISSTHSSCNDEEDVGSDSATIGLEAEKASWPCNTAEDIRGDAAPAVSIQPHIEDSETEECRALARGEATTGNNRRPDEMSLQLNGWFSSLIQISAGVVYDAVLAEVCGGGGHEQVLTDLEKQGAKTLKVLHRRADRTALAVGDAADAGVNKVIDVAVGDDLYGFADFKTMRRLEHLQTNAGQVKGTPHKHTRSRRRSRSSSPTRVGRRSLSRDKGQMGRKGSRAEKSVSERAHSTTSRKSGMLETRDGPAETVGPKPLASPLSTTSRKSAMMETRDGPAAIAAPMALARAHSTTSRKSAMMETKEGPADSVGPKALASAHSQTSQTSRKSATMQTRDGLVETVAPQALARAHSTTSRKSGMLETRDGPVETVGCKALAPERQMAVTDEATQPSSAAKRLNLRFWTRGKNKGLIKATSDAGSTY
jgi:hypothetical protein